MLRIPGHETYRLTGVIQPCLEDLQCSRGIQVPLVPVLRMMMMMYRYQRMGLTHWNSCCLASANLGEVVEDIFFLYENFNVFAYIWLVRLQTHSY